MSAYREPGTVDMTEIERAKIHEAAETKRKEIEEREESKRQARKLRKEWWDTNGFGVFWICFGAMAAATIAGVALTTDYWDHQHPAPCIDRATTGGEKCTHQEHDLVRRDGSNYCICRRPAPTVSASVAP